MDQIEEIKNKLDIVDVIKDYIKVEKAGINYRALCPFHSEKKPSLFISPTRQIWKCFGCQKGGDVFEFVKEIEGIEFGEALQILARKAGVELKRIDPKAVSKNKRLYELNEMACRFFEKQLGGSQAGKKAEKYLEEERKISKEMAKEWRIGYAPDNWHALTGFLSSSGFSRGEIEKTGFGIRNERGNFYDRFRGRIMFPIFDLHSRVVGFGGRIFKEKESGGAKYINTPNTPLYNKSRVLYGLNKARISIRKNEACIVAEGYTDVILSRAAGIENIVSASGTSLTSQQLQVLGRYTKNLLFAFDMDTAGSEATKRGIGLAQARGFNIKIILMPEAHDPADLIAEDVGRWKEIVSKPKDIIEFYFETALEKFNKNDPVGKKKIAESVLLVIKKIPNEIERFHWIQKIANELNVSEESIEKEMEKVKLNKEETGLSASEEMANIQEESKDKEALIEEELLSLFLQEPREAEMLERKDLEIFSPEGVEIFSAIKKLGLEEKGLKDNLSPKLFQKVQIASLQLEVRGKVENPKEEIENCIKEIKRIRYKKQMKAVSERLKHAEELEDNAQIKILTQEFDELSKKIKNG